MDKLLDKINSPADLKELSIKQLTALAGQIRQLIISTVGKTGGHLASNLGVVELTLALHYVFNFSKDKLLWDVGHQCYTHKIITGRRTGFVRLRQRNGVSGFPAPDESEYDQFAVGHAGTAIGTALGMALGAQHRGTNEKIVALVGDASIVNGPSFEAMNNLSLVKRQLLIVLNDNSMAIDVTQGALAKFLARVRLSQTYEDMRRTTSNILEHLPVIGKGMEEAIERIKKTIRMAVSPSQLFESLGIPYFGPVDGHNIKSLIDLFKALGELEHPAILHIYTKKGSGFTPAGDDPRKFHSTRPFQVNGDVVEVDTAGRSFTAAFGELLVEAAEKDKKIVAITAAMPDGTGLNRFRDKFPDRYYDVGMSESAATEIAAGLAKTGSKPVVCIYSTFLQRSYDQIFEEVALQNLPVVFCVDRAGFVGGDGPTHHGLTDIGFLRMMPNMILAGPANETELKSVIEFALEVGKPVAIRYPKDRLPADKMAAAGCDKPFELGKSITVKKSRGSKIAILAYGNILTEAIKASELLEKENIAVDVINARFAKPVDEKIISFLRRKKAIITVEDHSLACGFGSAVLESCAKSAYCEPGDSSGAERSYKKSLAGKIITLGGPDKFIQRHSRAEQLNQAGINADKIVEAVKAVFSETKRRVSKAKGQ